MKTKSILVIMTVVLTYYFVPISFATTVSFQGLGDLPGGDFFSIAFDISGNGNTVIGYSKSTLCSEMEAFRWTQANGMVGLGDLSGGNFYSRAENVSGNGAVVVGGSISSLSSPLTDMDFLFIPMTLFAHGLQFHLMSISKPERG